MKSLPLLAVLGGMAVSASAELGVELPKPAVPSAIIMGTAVRGAGPAFAAGTVAAPAAVAPAAIPDFAKMSGAQAKEAGQSDFLRRLAGFLQGGNPPDAPPPPAKADFRRTEVLKLRMTQMAVGMREVAEKAAKLREMKEEDAREYLKKKEIPAVIGPDGHLYIIDHHHLVRAAWEAGITDVHVKIRADLSAHSKEQFWLKMAAAKWIYPYDQFGKGPYDPIHLPEDVRGLANDPYRDVAWQVRERGGYDKTDAPFSEFHWANFFREHLKAYPVFHDFETAVAEALKLAKSELAKSLPGYKGGK